MWTSGPRSHSLCACVRPKVISLLLNAAFKIEYNGGELELKPTEYVQR